MLSAEIIKSLKSTNTSVNSELTKQRVKEILQKASRKQKNEIDALSGLKRVSLNRVYVTGNISAKIAIAIAQVLRIDPFFLTGETDERGDCTDKRINAFLIAKGYAGTVDNTEKPAPEPKEAKAPVEKTGATPSVCKTDDEVSLSKMTEEEAVHLLRSLFIQAKFSETAKETLDKIKAGLLTP